MTEVRAPARAQGWCPRCGARYEAWSCLELLGLVSAERLRSLLTSWDDRQRVEVRRCPRCGAPLARLADAPEAQQA